MTWLWLSLGAALIWAVVSIIDKVSVERYVPSALTYLLFTGLTTGLVVIAVPLFKQVHSVPVWLALLSILTGALFLASTYLFFRSLEVSDAPVVTTLLALVPVFSVILGFVLFNERFPLYVYGGILAVLLGTVVVSIEDRGAGKRGKAPSRALFLMVLYAILASIDYALQKYILGHIDTPTFFFWARVGDFGVALVLLFLLSSARRDFVDTLRRIPKLILGISFGNELLNLVATYAVAAAYAMGALALVTTGLATQSLFVLMIIPVVNALRHGLIPEAHRGWRVLFLRAIAIAITVVGVYLISLGRP